MITIPDWLFCSWEQNSRNGNLVIPEFWEAPHMSALAPFTLFLLGIIILYFFFFFCCFRFSFLFDFIPNKTKGESLAFLHTEKNSLLRPPALIF